MEWLSTSEGLKERKELNNLKKWEKFTLYDHNFISTFNDEDETFVCVLNCKKTNRIYSTICKI